MGSTMKDRFSEGFSKLSERLNDGFSRLGSNSSGDAADDSAPPGIQENKKTGTSNKKSISEHLSTATAKMKDLFRTPTVAERLVEEATAAGLESPDWAKILAICDLVNTQKAPGQEVTLAVKKRLSENDNRVQALALVLLESLVKNCEGVFSDVASSRVLDDLVSIGREAGNPNSTKALILIEAWGEAKDELRYLPVFAETYTSLQAQGVRFPGRDAESLVPIFTPAATAPITTPAASAASHTAAPQEVPPADLVARSKETFEVARNSRDLLDTVLTSAPQEETLKEELTLTLVAQVQRSQREVQQLIQVAGDNEAVLFEALNVNDDLQKSLTKYEELAGAANPPTVTATRPDVAPAAQRPIPNSTSVPSHPPTASAKEHPQAAVYAELLGEDEEDESALVRKNGHKNTRPQAQGGEEQALADLDEMIFGKKESPSEAQTKEEKKDDLISF